MRRQRWQLGKSLAFVTLVGLVAVPVACKKREEQVKVDVPVQRETVTFCRGGILTLLPQVAQDRGYFSAEGVEARFTTYGDGKLAMEGMLKGDCDVATVGEPPIVTHSFQRNDFAILATLASSDNATKILARRDRGIAKPGDLRGKRVGVGKGTISHFFFEQFLKKNGVPPESVTIAFMPLKEMPEALASGAIDAYSASDLFYLKGLHLLAERAVTFSEPGLCFNAASLVAKKDWIANRPATARSVLRALLRAEGFVAASPEETGKLMAATQQIDRDDLETIMKSQRHTLELSRLLLLSLEDHGRWMATGKSGAPVAIPNYLEFMATAPLRSLKPAAVTVDRQDNHR
jgi:NitT/TauT family transport system substrate-binding protein